MQAVDKPGKDQKHPHYEHRTNKMMTKNNEFTEKKFQKIRHVSNQKKLLHSFKIIGKCLNECQIGEIPSEGLDKVCFILMNNHEHDKHDAKIGPLNDGYLFALIHHRLGFKVFYLHNCAVEQYLNFLQFFLKNTTESLTVYYSGQDSAQSNGSHGIEFKHESTESGKISEIIANDNNGSCKVVFVSDCACGGSVYDIQLAKSRQNPSPMIAFSVNKSTDPNSKKGRRSHGLFTYYFIKVIYEDPDVSPQRLVERLNDFFIRFDSSVSCDTTNPGILDQPMYHPEHHTEDKEEEMIDDLIKDVSDSEVSDED